MSLPREPRQKMINMMYLVLTALLALNVSSEILNAFKTVNNSLEKTNSVVDASTGELVTSLEAKLSDAGTKEKAVIWFPNAQKAQTMSKDVYTYLQGLKDNILKLADGDPSNPEKSYKEDNLDIATRLMIDQGEGKTLYAKLDQLKKGLLNIDPLVQKQFANSLPIDLSMPKSTRQSNNKSWEYAYFHMVPTVAALTILSKFQNDVKTAENKVVAFCHEQVGKVEFRFNQYEPIVGQNSKVLLAGQDLEITAGLAAFNSDQKPDVYVGGNKVQLNDKGLAVWKNAVNSSGKIPVKIQFTNQEGKVQEKSFDVEYTVGQSNAAVQLDKMNVLFIGVDNPITISGSGSVDQLQVSASGGGAVLGGSGARRTVRVNSETDECIISIRTIDGKVTPVRFRVRSIPDPTPRVGANESGDMPAGVFVSQAGVNAIVKNFFYETQFNVTGFRMTGDGSGFEEGIEEAVNTGAAWNEAKKIIRKCRSGSYITIEDIRAVGPDGRSRKLSPLIFQLR